MDSIGLIGGGLIVINIIFSYQGFRDPIFFEKYVFNVDKILISKQYIRLISSGFLHANWTHLALNMLTLYFFSSGVETTLGGSGFLILYFASLIGGDLLALFIHRNHGDYTSVGASGAISGVVFASIAIFPGMSIGMFGLLWIPGWAYGLFYTLFSIYGIKSGKGNIGHDAHLGGGIVGMLVAICMMPESITNNYLPIILVLVPAIAFFALILIKPEFLLVDNIFRKSDGLQTKEERYNGAIRNKEKEIDRILDKISKKGLEKLSKKERETLDNHSR
jgi:membrane associated rhomboid family serine protease